MWETQGLRKAEQISVPSRLAGAEVTSQGIWVAVPAALAVLLTGYGPLNWPYRSLLWTSVPWQRKVSSCSDSEGFQKRRCNMLWFRLLIGVMLGIRSVSPRWGKRWNCSSQQWQGSGLGPGASAQTPPHGAGGAGCGLRWDIKSGGRNSI